MAYSNKFHSLLLTTGNKSELATGYCTLYGDMCGVLAVIGDLFKTEVYALARSLNRKKTVIPDSVLLKAPSAELRPDQIDQDSLPPYELLDQILQLYLLQSKTLEEITAAGFEKDLVKNVLTMVGKAEFKRRQAPPVLKVSPRAFGTGRRIPIARRIHEA
jgi:NAD+ synthase (glutamine-hydrolysing)